MAHEVVIAPRDDEVSDDIDETLVDTIATKRKRKCFKYKRNPCSFYQVKLILFPTSFLFIPLLPPFRGYLLMFPGNFQRETRPLIEK